ncbi:MAG: helix-turn-helix domain-containing protein [Bacteroidales bacterium]|nr:helix-turn-helix domain-containing protein [Bacteroidales bacterium]
MIQASEIQTLEQLPKAVFKLFREIDDVKYLIKSIAEANEQSADRWMNVDQLIDYLPGKPSKQTVYCWVNSGTIPHHKPSQGRLAFRKSEIDKWLGIERLVYNNDLEEEENKPLLPKKACGSTISRKGGYK